MIDEYMSTIWHFKVDDDLSWNACAEILKQNDVADISGQQLKKEFLKFFKELVGIEPYTKCPVCGKKLLPRQSKYGYFVACSGFPACKFLASNTKRYKKRNEQNNDK